MHALEDVTDPVYIFGSRTQPEKRGGDIDLLIFSQQSAYQLSKRIAVKFFTKLEQKIDVLVLDPENISPGQRAFLKIINKVQIQ